MVIAGTTPLSSVSATHWPAVVSQVSVFSVIRSPEGGNGHSEGRSLNTTRLCSTGFTHSQVAPFLETAQTHFSSIVKLRIRERLCLSHYPGNGVMTI